MKKTKKLLSLVMASTVALTTCIVNTPALMAKADTTTTETPKPVPQTASTQYAAAMYPGWNLGNSFEAINWDTNLPSETAWNPAVTRALIDKIASEGFHSIRMPFTTFTKEVAAPYTIDQTYLARYKEVVQWAVDDGLYVLVDPVHGDSWEYLVYYEAPDDGGQAKAQYEAVWTQLADALKDLDSKVCFESQNELAFKNHSGDIYHDWDSPDVKPKEIQEMNRRMKDLNQDFYNIVRKSGGNNATRMLSMPPVGHTGSAQWCDSTSNQILGLKDPNIMSSFHFYYSYSQAGTNYDTFNANEIKNVRDTFDTAYNDFVKNGIGVTIGEMGMFDNAYSFIEPGEVLKSLEYGFQYAKVDGLTPMLWDRGTDYMDRNTLTWKDPKKINTIKATWTGRASYAYSDRIFVKDQDKNSDVNVPLTLNGNMLSSIYNGTTQLVEGQDYTYANDTVTLKGSYVYSLMTAGYGTKATLTFNFSHGPAWNADLIRYTTPVVSSVTGSTSNFVIPVQFNGSILQSLEAVKLDGYSPVGAVGYSTYKFSDAYKVDYSANTLTMTDVFFNVKDNYDNTLDKYVIKLHFQSGEEQDLTINQADGKLTYNAPVVSTTPTAKVTADNSNVIIERNQTPSFTVSMNNLTNANAFDVTLNYDSGLYNVSKIDYLVPGLSEVSKSDNNGTLRLIFGKTDKGTITSNDYKDLVKVTLTPKAFFIKQATSVQLVKADSASINNGVAANATCTLGQALGQVTIKLASDINDDGKVDLADLSIALAHYMDDKDSVDDIDGSGVVDIVDLQLIAGYIK